jgi:hypothetical protein
MTNHYFDPKEILNKSREIIDRSASQLIRYSKSQL